MHHRRQLLDETKIGCCSIAACSLDELVSGPDVEGLVPHEAVDHVAKLPQQRLHELDVEVVDLGDQRVLDGVAGGVAGPTLAVGHVVDDASDEPVGEHVRCIVCPRRLAHGQPVTKVVEHTEAPRPGVLVALPHRLDRERKLPDLGLALPVTAVVAGPAVPVALAPARPGDPEGAVRAESPVVEEGVALGVVAVVADVVVPALLGEHDAGTLGLGEAGRQPVDLLVPGGAV
mmetsp:Transcript_9175/g.20879  ORF Transcript_9175/g.20879 Transcript_9175/m.20879 type:complete len:231 (-) Transcript_9175:60-752(-)